MLVAIVAVAFLWIIVITWGPLSNRQGSAPTTEAGLLNAGLAAQSAGRMSEAATDYHKVLQMNPNNPWAYYNLGLMDQQAGRNASAETNYRGALKISPGFLAALFNLAILRTAAAPTEAEDLYRQALVVAPGNAGVHLNLGFLLIQEGKTVEGRAELQKAVKLDPTMASRLPPSPTPSASHKP